MKNKTWLVYWGNYKTSKLMTKKEALIKMYIFKGFWIANIKKNTPELIKNNLVYTLYKDKIINQFGQTEFTGDIVYQIIDRFKEELSDKHYLNV